MEHLSTEEIQAKADELSIRYKVQVHPLVFTEGEDQIVGYFQEPNRMTKFRVLDKSYVSPAMAASELLEATLIKEESNPRIYSERSEDDKINIGAALACFSSISVSIQQFKKK